MWYTPKVHLKRRKQKRMTCSLINNTNTYNVTCSDVENNRHILSNTNIFQANCVRETKSIRYTYYSFKHKAREKYGNI